MKNKIVLLVICILGLIGCDKESNETSNELGGYYKIISMVSNVQADVNNDGVQSNLYEEIAGKHIINNEVVDVFYDFDSWDSYAEIKKGGSNSNWRFISFNYPFQEIMYLGLNQEIPFCSDYLNRFNTFYYTKENKEGEIELLDGNSDYTADYGEVLSFNKLDKDNFILLLSTKLFDFKTKTWKPAEVTVKYKRVIN